MTKRTIMEMAREAGIGWGEKLEGMPDFLEAFAKLVREDERNCTWTQQHWTDYERSIAAAERKKVLKEIADAKSNETNI